MTKSSNLNHRWSELVALVRKQFDQHQQDSNLLEADRTKLKLAALRKLHPYERHTETWDEEAVLTGDLPAMAVHFYEEYRKEW